MIVKFWGTRGSIPVPGATTIKYGGNTPCVQIITKENECIILDAGTGIRQLGNHLVKENQFKRLSILISHNHWDHIQGIPFFLPLFRKEFSVDFYSNPESGINSESVVDALMNPTFFPVDKEIFNAKISYNSIYASQIFTIGNTSIETIKVNHSNGTLAFKITEGDNSVVYMTDNEIKYDKQNDSIDVNSLNILNNDLIKFCKNCTYLIHDSMYTVEDYKNKLGWGHSNNISAGYLALIGDVKNLVLFHFDPDYTDEVIDILFFETKNHFEINNSKINCIASWEGLELEI